MPLKKITNVSNLLIIVILEESNNMTATAIVNPKFYGVDSDGNPLAGGQLHAYEAGTLNRKTTWSDPLQVTANANPIILNGSGRADVYLSGSYKLVLQDSNGVPIWEQDNVYSSSPSEFIEDAEATYINTKSFSIIGNKTEAYGVNRAIRVQATGADTYSHITETSYANSITTVVIEDAIIDTAINIVSVSITTIKSLPSNLQDVLDSSFGRIGNNILRNPDKKLKKYGFDNNYLNLTENEMGHLCWMRGSDPEEHYQYAPEAEIEGGQYTLSWTGGGQANVEANEELETNLTSPATFYLTPGEGNVKITLPTSSTRMKLEEGPRNTGDENRHIDVERVICAPFFRERVAVARGDYIGVHAEARTSSVIEFVIPLEPPMFKTPSPTYSNVDATLGTDSSTRYTLTFEDLGNSSRYAHTQAARDTGDSQVFTVGQRYELSGEFAGGYFRLDANIRSN